MAAIIVNFTNESAPTHDVVEDPIAARFKHNVRAAFARLAVPAVPMQSEAERVHSEVAFSRSLGF